jgi:hypothetical protein
MPQLKARDSQSVQRKSRPTYMLPKEVHCKYKQVKI